VPPQGNPKDNATPAGPPMPPPKAPQEKPNDNGALMPPPPVPPKKAPHNPPHHPVDPTKLALPVNLVPQLIPAINVRGIMAPAIHQPRAIHRGSALRGLDPASLGGVPVTGIPRPTKRSRDEDDGGEKDVEVILKPSKRKGDEDMRIKLLKRTIPFSNSDLHGCFRGGACLRVF
jgi:hypothetical protein